jgi:hypothetical protein
MRHAHALFFSFVKRQQSDAPAADVNVRSARLLEKKKREHADVPQKKKTIACGTRLLRMSTCEACLCCAQCDAARASGAPKLGFFFFGSAPSMRIRRTHMYTDVVVVAIVVIPSSNTWRAQPRAPQRRALRFTCPGSACSRQKRGRPFGGGGCAIAASIGA